SLTRGKILRPRPSGIAARGPEDLPAPDREVRTNVQRYRLALHASPDGAVMGWRPTPEQRVALVRAHELASQMRDGGTTWKAVADRLTADGYPTVNGAPWTYQMVQRLVRKPPSADPTTTLHRQERLPVLQEVHARAHPAVEGRPEGQARSRQARQPGTSRQGQGKLGGAGLRADRPGAGEPPPGLAEAPGARAGRTGSRGGTGRRSVARHAVTGGRGASPGLLAMPARARACIVGPCRTCIGDCTADLGAHVRPGIGGG